MADKLSAKKEREEDNDIDFQNKIQEAENDETLPDTSKQEPCYNNEISGRTVAKKASISKQALKKASFKCTFDNSHATFMTSKKAPKATRIVSLSASLSGRACAGRKVKRISSTSKIVLKREAPVPNGLNQESPFHTDNPPHLHAHFLPFAEVQGFGKRQKTAFLFRSPSEHLRRKLRALVLVPIRIGLRHAAGAI